MASLHISIAAEPIFKLGGVEITNSIFTSWIVSALIIFVALYAHSKIKHTRRPQGLQNLFEAIVDGFYNLTYSITQSKVKADQIFPWITTFFLWILLNNWFGLLPGVGTIGIIEGEPHAQSLFPVANASTQEEVEKVFIEGENPEGQLLPSEGSDVTTPETEKGKFVPIFRAATADLNTTLALAIISIGMVQFFGIKHLGLSYFSKFINFKGPIDAFVGLLETVSELVKIVSFAFRLFGNIFAGEVLLAVMSFLVPILVPIPFIGLEIFVGVIQALVFALLSLVFMSMATHGHADEH